jgi:hypothetical protein
MRFRVLLVWLSCLLSVAALAATARAQTSGQQGGGSPPSTGGEAPGSPGTATPGATATTPAPTPPDVAPVDPAAAPGATTPAPAVPPAGPDTPTTAPPGATTVAPGAPASEAPSGAEATPPERAGGGYDGDAWLVGFGVVAALLLLALALWGLARWWAWEPRWLVRFRHATGEAGWRLSNAWAEFGDWLRLGR